MTGADAQKFLPNGGGAAPQRIETVQKRRGIPAFVEADKLVARETVNRSIRARQIPYVLCKTG